MNSRFRRNMFRARPAVDTSPARPEGDDTLPPSAFMHDTVPARENPFQPRRDFVPGRADATHDLETKEFGVGEFDRVEPQRVESQRVEPQRAVSRARYEVGAARPGFAAAGMGAGPATTDLAGEPLSPHIHPLRPRVGRLREQLKGRTSTAADWSWRTLTRPENLLTTLVRLGFMLMVVAVLTGVWIVASAHLEEQLLGAPQTTSGLIDPSAGQGALTPDNIEQQILAFSLRLRETELDIPAGTDLRPRPFTINPGEAARFVATRLQNAGFVHDADLFNLYLRVNGLERRIEAGNFMLVETMTIPEVAQALQTALFEEVLVTIPEGFRAEEIAERLAENNVIEPDRFLAAVRQPRSLSIYGDYSFLADLPADASLEGFLFPDTYRFPVLASRPELVLAPFLNNFRARAGSELAGGASGFTGRDLLILASIVEREAVQADERPLIASVYANRLASRCLQEVGGTYLQADPTVQYARGTVGDWWWKPTDISEYATVISPYNTYLYPGLPPGPIASPGLSAIQAAANPAISEYCFFLGTGEEGRHVFSRTLAEHEQYMRAYGY